MADAKISALTARTAPALADIVPLATSTPSNASISLAALFGQALCTISGFRLSSENAGVPTANNSNVSTIYYAPHISGFIIVPDNSGTWKVRNNASISLALSSLTSGKNYDVFVWDNAGTLTLAQSTAWTNDTTRANALTTINGVYVNGSTEGSMAANRGLHVGIIRTTSTTQTQDSLTQRFICNRYNRLRRALRTVPNYSNGNTETTYTFTNTSFADIGGTKLEFIKMAGEIVIGNYCAYVTVSNSNWAKIGLGVDSTTDVSQCSLGYTNLCIGNRYRFNGLSEGYHYINLNGCTQASTTVTLSADAVRHGATADPSLTYLEAVVYV